MKESEVRSQEPGFRSRPCKSCHSERSEESRLGFWRESEQDSSLSRESVILSEAKNLH